MIINVRWGRQIQFDPGTLMVIATIGAVSSVAGGVGQMNAANQEASLQKQQGEIALQESQVNANNEAYNQTEAVQRQRLAFLANGVSLEGSPSQVLAASKAYGQTQVNSILNQGAARYNLAQQEAAITKNKGRAALISSIAGAVGTEASAGGTAYKAGLFNSGGSPLQGGGDFGNFATNGGKGF